MVKHLCMQGSVPASLWASKRKDYCSPSACTSEKSHGFLSNVKDYSKFGGGAKQSSPGLVIRSKSAEMLQLLPDYSTRCIIFQMDFLYCGGRFRQVESFWKSFPLNVTPPDTFAEVSVMTSSSTIKVRSHVSLPASSTQKLNHFH